MPHESTTEHEQIEFQEDEEKLVQTRNRSRSFPVDNFSHHARDSKAPPRTLSLIAKTPMKITHHHDDDDDDDDKSGGAAVDAVSA